MEEKVAGHNFLASDMTIPEIFGDVIGEYVADTLTESEDELEEGEKERYMNPGLEDLYDICYDKLTEIVRDSGNRIIDVAEMSAREYLEPLWGPTRRGASRSDERIQAAVLRGVKRALGSDDESAAENGATQNRCPACGSGELDFYDFEAQGLNVMEEWTCDACKAYGHQVYEFVDNIVDSEGEDKAPPSRQDVSDLGPLI